MISDPSFSRGCASDFFKVYGACGANLFTYAMTNQKAVNARQSNGRSHIYIYIYIYILWHPGVRGEGGAGDGLGGDRSWGEEKEAWKTKPQHTKQKY